MWKKAFSNIFVKLVLKYVKINRDTEGWQEIAAIWQDKKTIAEKRKKYFQNRKKNAELRNYLESGGCRLHHGDPRVPDHV